MNGFHAHWRFMSAHERASTIGKKIANSTVGKTIRACPGYARGGTLAQGAAGRPPVNGERHDPPIGRDGASLEPRVAWPASPRRGRCAAMPVDGPTARRA